MPLAPDHGAASHLPLPPAVFRECFGEDLELTLDAWLNDVPPTERASVVACATLDLARASPGLWLRSNTPYVVLLSLFARH